MQRGKNARALTNRKRTRVASGVSNRTALWRRRDGSPLLSEQTVLLRLRLPRCDHAWQENMVSLPPSCQDSSRPTP